MKVRWGLAMLAVGVVLLVIFFISYNPNHLLRKVSQNQNPPRDPVPTAHNLDPAEVDSFLAAYNPRYTELKSTWMTRQYQALAGIGDVDPHQVEAAHLALLSFAGSRENVDTINRLYPLLTLAQSQDHQLGKARRMAALWPAYLPPGLADLWANAQTSPDGLPALYAYRNRAAAIMGYASYLDVLADDLDLDLATWSTYLATVLAANRPLYDQIHRYLARTLASGHQVPVPDLLPVDWLGSDEPVAVSRALVDLDLPGGTDPGPTGGGAWARALAFRRALDLTALPASVDQLQPIWIKVSSGEPRVRWFPLGPDQGFGVILGLPRDQDLTLDAVGALGQIDLQLACSGAQYPPLLQEATCRAFALAMEHLYTLAARAAGESSDPNLALPHTPQPLRLLRQALTGPIWRTPLVAGSYLAWLQDLNRGQLPAPIVSTKFWQYAATEAQLAPPRSQTPPRVLFTEAFGPDTQPAQPLDDILGWVIAHQLHRYICHQLLDQNVYTGDYRHNPKVGDFLLAILKQGRGQNWESLLRAATGEEFDPAAMMEYYQPLSDWLQTQ